MSREDNTSENGCFRVFCTEEKKDIAERLKQTVDEEATINVLKMMNYSNKEY